MTVLEDGQIEFDGFLLGPGTPYQRVAGPTPGHVVRTSDMPRPAGPGLFLGQDYPDAPPVVVDIRVKGSDLEDVWEKYYDLAAAWSTRGTEGFVGSAPLIFKRAGQVQRRYNNGRPRDIVVDDSQAKHGIILASLTFQSEVPFELSDEEHVVDLVHNASNETLPNAGNHAASVQWDVYGQVTDPGVIRSEADRFDMDTAIGNLDYYRVRTDAKTVTRASDSGNLRETFSGTWLEIPAGGALFRTVGTAGSGSVKTRATWRDTWWA